MNDFVCGCGCVWVYVCVFCVCGIYRLYAKPFAVVPCCVFPSLFPHRRLRNGEKVVSYAHLLEYLQHQGCLPCGRDGENVVVEERGRDMFEEQGGQSSGEITCAFLAFQGRNKVLYRLTACS